MDQRIKGHDDAAASPCEGSFLGCGIARPMADDSEHGEGQHNQRHVTMPSVPGACLVMVEAKPVLGGLEAVLDGAAMPFYLHQRLNGRADQTPCREEGQIAIGVGAPDQKTARPDLGSVFAVSAALRSASSQYAQS